MLEQQGQKREADKLTKAGWFVTKVISTNRNGFPDLIAFKPGHPPKLIECKTSKGRRSPIQKLMAEKLTKAGCDVMVVNVSTGLEIHDNPLRVETDVGF